MDGSASGSSFWRITLPLLAADPGTLVLGDHGDRLVPGLRHRWPTTRADRSNASRVMQYYIFQGSGFAQARVRLLRLARCR